MKKIIAFILVLCLCVGLCACGAENQFTIEELYSALRGEDIEIDDSVINQTEKGFDFLFETDNLLVSGTADENQNVNYIMFANIGLDVSVFSNNDIFEKWFARTSEIDLNTATVKEISEILVADNCISELEAFYRLTSDGEDAMLFAINTLLGKESSEIECWTINVSVDSDRGMLITEAIGLNANAAENPFEEVDRINTEIGYQKAVSNLSTNPNSAHDFFLENREYKDSAKYLEKFKPICVLKKTKDSSTTYTYNDDLLIQEEITINNGKTDVVTYTYRSNGILLKKVCKYASGMITETEYDEYGYPTKELTQRPNISNLRSLYENTYYDSGKIKTRRETNQETDSSGNWKDVYICNTVYEENGNYETTYEMSITGSQSTTVKCDANGNEIYVEYRGKYPAVFTYKYEYNSNGRILFKRNNNSNTYDGYEYNEEGLLVYAYSCSADNTRYLEAWYEYTYIYQE